MPKHRADRQLTHDNWDDVEEAEEAGQFVQASDDVIKQRKIKRAVRRGGNSATNTDGSSGAFSGFGGFGALNSDSLFSNKPLQTNGSTTTTGCVSAALKIFEPTTAAAEKTMNGVNKKGDNSGYLKQLKSLNESVVAWIKQHVDKNPYCLLTPIFNDYEKHLLEIEKKYPKKGTEEKQDQNEDSKEETKSAEAKPTKSPEKTVGMFSVPTATTEPAKISPFSAFKFGTVTQSDFKPSFTFGGATGTGTATTTGVSNTEAQAEGEEAEEYVPPKAEVRTIVEEGEVYTKRCKLFYQKEGAWVEKGVGNIHLKEVGDKSQLVVRADNSLGNVLLNILITKSLPTKRQGKNNVSLMCVPNPPLDPKTGGDNTAVPLLVRVKTGDDADELLKNIDEMKK